MLLKVKFISLIIILTFLDLFTKNLAFSYVTEIVIENNLPFYMVEITNFFNLVIVWNKGVSFGMFSNLEYAKY
jgi:lipoprotein signal peptidase